jgi:uncharacterized protein
VLINSEFDVAAPVEQVWDYLNDVPRMAPCLPGAELTEVVDEDNYKGRVTAKLGPVSLRFAGTVHIVSRDEKTRTVVLDADGAEERGKGQASMRITAGLTAAGRGTRVAVRQDVQITGAAAQFGRGMIAEVTNMLMRTFSTNVADDIPRWLRGEERQAGASVPASGLALGVRATINGVQRFFRRVFGTGTERTFALARGR